MTILFFHFSEDAYESSSSDGECEEETSQKANISTDTNQRHQKVVTPTNTPSRAERMRAYRQNMTAEQKAFYNNQAKKRMAQKRDQVKEFEEELTEEQLLKKREKWRKYKETYRKKLSPKKKNELEVRKACSTLCKLSTKDFLEVLEQHLITPKRKQQMKADWIYISPSSRETVAIKTLVADNVRKQLKMLGTDKKSTNKRKTLIEPFVKSKEAKRIRKVLGVPLATWKTASKDESRKQRKEKQKELATQFFNSVSIPSPCKRHAGKSVLPDTLKNLYDEYAKSYPDSFQRLSFSMFKKQRPSNVKTVDHTHIIGCVCEYCANTMYQASIFLYFESLYNAGTSSLIFDLEKYLMVMVILECGEPPPLGHFSRLIYIFLAYK